MTYLMLLKCIERDRERGKRETQREREKERGKREKERYAYSKLWLP